MGIILLGVNGRDNPLVDAAQQIVATRAFTKQATSLTASNVIKWFRSQCKGLRGARVDMVPAATMSLALVSIAGDLPDPASEIPDPTFHGNTYQLFDIGRVTSGPVWRLNSKGLLIAFYPNKGEWHRHTRVVKP